MDTHINDVQRAKQTERQDEHTTSDEETISAPAIQRQRAPPTAARRVIQLTEEQLQALVADAVAKYVNQHQRINEPCVAPQGVGINIPIGQRTEPRQATAAKGAQHIPQTEKEPSQQIPVQPIPQPIRRTTRRQEELLGEEVSSSATIPTEGTIRPNRGTPLMAYGTEEVPQSEERTATRSKGLGLTTIRGSPFSTKVLSETLPPGFKIPNLSEYDGTNDPQDHLDQFLAKMELHDATDAITCRVFRTTLTKKAQTWFSQLTPGSVTTFEQLSARFLRHFVSNRKCPKTANHLFTIVQGEKESLRDYVHRFTNELLEVPHVNEELLSSIILRGLRRGRFKSSLAGKPPATLDELLARAEKYIRIEETLGAEAAPPGKRKGREETGESSKKSREDNRITRSPPRRFNHYTPLNAPLREVLVTMERKDILRWPKPMRENVGRQKSDKYCRFHRDKGHDTESCYQLKEEIERLIRRGYLKEFVRSSAHHSEHSPRYPRDGREENRRDHREAGNTPRNHEERPAGVIAMIAGGPVGGDSMRARKIAAREARHQGNYNHISRKQINAVDSKIEQMTFTDEDLEGIIVPHNDALVVTVTVANYEIKRVLIDSGSSADIIFYSAFQQLGIGRDRLHKINTPLIGFGGQSVNPCGEITLPLSMGAQPARKMEMTQFLVVEANSSYNMILGRPTLNRFRAIISTYHLKIKFLTTGGIGILKGEQAVARGCYTTTLKNSKNEPGSQESKLPQRIKKASEDPGEIRESREHKRIKCGTTLEAVEEIKLIRVVPEKPERTIRIGTMLSSETEILLIKFLKQNTDIFAWEPTDMKGIDPSMAMHHLNVDPKAHPVKQRKRTFGKERNQTIKEEVNKLLAVGFIREVQYPHWLANVVLVPKPNGKWRMCIDFTDLNKACPKDFYPLPKIDLLVDSTSGCALLSFMDAHQGYNQILLNPEDQEKTSFITDMGTFCYNVMPFGLKNAGATYQRLMNKMFEAQIGRNMEVYVDDMLIKSEIENTHVADLQESFHTMRKYGMKLNPAKCTFGIKGGKFLGYIITERGIEANPSKIQAIQDMKPPQNVKEVQRLTGRLAALNRFISRSADKGLPFFKILRTVKNFEWTPECQQAFEQLKKYLSSPPLLTKPKPGEKLYLYLAVTSNAISSVLVRADGREHSPVYYVSKMLQNAEKNYTDIEKLVLALVHSTRRLRPYFQSHQVVVLTNQPIKHIITKPETAGRMMKWAVELGQYGLAFQSRPAIKAQVLADFIAEFSMTKDAIAEAETHTPPWTLYVDGSSTTTSSGAGIYLRSPENDELEFAVKFELLASNNEAEYGALIVGMELALSAGARKLIAYSDSQLVVSQVNGEYEVRGQQLIGSRERVKKLGEQFEEFHLKQIPRTENAKADRLARMASAMTNIDSQKITFLTLAKPEIETQCESIMCTADTETCWKDELTAYLTSGVVPENKKQALTLQRKATKFAVINGELYKKAYSQPYQKCLEPKQAEYVLKEVHEGSCGNHAGARSLAGKVLRQGYFWPTLLEDAKELVKKCHSCQEHANISHLPAAPLESLESPCPFDQWGMDIVGPFPPATGQRKFLIVAVDYFTKWVEAEPLAHITEEKVMSFLWKNIICRFGITRSLISDNGTQFQGKKLQSWCQELNIRQCFTSVGNPRANGQAELTNRTILQHLKARLGGAKGNWADELPGVLWAYRTTPRTSTGETPFALTYGTEAVIPVEIGEPTWRVNKYQPESNSQGLRTNLDLIEELREKANIRAAIYRARMVRHYNARVKLRQLQVGDLVMRKVEVSKPVGKLDSKWQGPYRVIEIVKAGAYRLEDMSGKALPRTWNIHNLKKYYA